MSIRTISLVVSLLLGVAAVEAAPVSVRLPEGNTRGFLVLRSPDGEVIAHGELRQKPAQGSIESRLSLAFKDGSHREEIAVFSQDKDLSPRELSSRRARPLVSHGGDRVRSEEWTVQGAHARQEGRRGARGGRPDRDACRSVQRDGPRAAEEPRRRREGQRADGGLHAEASTDQDGSESRRGGEGPVRGNRPDGQALPREAGDRRAHRRRSPRSSAKTRRTPATGWPRETSRPSSDSKARCS